MIFRQLGESRALKAALTSAGREVVYAPMLQIRHLLCPPVPRETTHGILTSQNAMKALISLKQNTIPPLFVVGQATATLAGEAGFNVIATALDARRLEQGIAGTVAPQEARFFYPRGRDLAYDLSGALVRRGYKVDAPIVYQADEVKVLAPETVQALAQERPEAMVFYSRRAAKIFLQRLAESLPDAKLGKVHAFVLSPRIAEALEGAGFAGVHSAEEPSEACVQALMRGHGFPA